LFANPKKFNKPILDKTSIEFQVLISVDFGGLNLGPIQEVLSPQSGHLASSIYSVIPLTSLASFLLNAFLQLQQMYFDL
jgi:hypothetical protein